jgi:hypothetical protein
MSSLIYLYKKVFVYYKMAEEIINSYIIADPQQYDNKKQKLLECVMTGNSKLYLGKIYTEEQINKLTSEEIDKLFNLYESKLSSLMVKSLGKSIINMYSLGACSILGINNQDALTNDLENDPFLNSALQRFTCDLYYRFGYLISPFTVGLITSKHYFSEKNISNINGDDRKISNNNSNTSDNEKSEKS